ncbi:hypothetical protein Nepgr_010850 [Nepenthes gracilis]|uniref:Uncharacterized protein n=1 Tax=Nepenthes gracilis TaxID=150966 RepID=A0AAD3SE12_NEPGR|nr:hypothetical protein Nepgr_010850 [Nepenthes gracilis]
MPGRHWKQRSGALIVRFLIEKENPKFWASRGSFGFLSTYKKRVAIDLKESAIEIRNSMDGEANMGLLNDPFDPANILGREMDEGYESRSGSDNYDGLSNDNDQHAANKRGRMKKYHRHTPQQIQELENFFKDCPHPDEKQRLDLGRRLGLESRQVKFWFQNRRTQLKTQMERHENIVLKQEYDKLRFENMAMKEAMGNPLCKNCSGGTKFGDSSIDEHHIRLENARLKDELARILAIAERFMDKPITEFVNCNSQLSAGSSGISGLIGGPSSSGNLEIVPISSASCTGPLINEYERSIYLQVAVSAMEELVSVAESDSPLWYKSSDGGNEALNLEEYEKKFSPYGGMKPAGFVTVATRVTGSVIISSLELVESFMSANRWIEMFPYMIGKASTLEVLYNGVGGTRDGELQMMDAECLFPSPLVPLRRGRFLRFCKQHSQSVWAVVDVSVENAREIAYPDSFMRYKKKPSGCIVQDLANGCSLVTWIEHVEYDESCAHHLYRPLLRSGLAFGAHRWLATLQCQCECSALLLSDKISLEDDSGLTLEGRRSIVKLARRMSSNFCAGVCASSVRRWEKLELAGVGEDVRVMTRVSLNEPGEPSGVVLSTAKSVWLPISRRQLFDFLRDDQSRGRWDILSNGGPMQEMARVSQGQDAANCITLLCPPAAPARESNMLILQESWTEETSSLIVYAPVDVASMTAIMGGKDSEFLALLPSGFAIADAIVDHNMTVVPNARFLCDGAEGTLTTGSLLTLGFQILVNSLPNAKLTVESIETVNGLVACTIQKIEGALCCN